THGTRRRGAKNSRHWWLLGWGRRPAWPAPAQGRRLRQTRDLRRGARECFNCGHRSRGKIAVNANSLRRLAPPAVFLLALQAPQAANAFTAEQAAAGAAAYAQHCVACHGESLRQLPDALLGGREFLAKWGTLGTNELVEKLAAS